MSETQARLTRCFRSVFPKLKEEEIASASIETVETWNSVVTVTLLTVIEEEFGIQFELDVLESLVSYRSILGYLMQLPATSAANKQ